MNLPRLINNHHTHNYGNNHSHLPYNHVQGQSHIHNNLPYNHVQGHIQNHSLLSNNCNNNISNGHYMNMRN